jgi:hypothetical protein
MIAKHTPFQKNPQTTFISVVHAWQDVAMRRQKSAKAIVASRVRSLRAEPICLPVSGGRQWLHTRTSLDAGGKTGIQQATGHIFGIGQQAGL